MRGCVRRPSATCIGAHRQKAGARRGDAGRRRGQQVPLRPGAVEAQGRRPARRLATVLHVAGPGRVSDCNTLLSRSCRTQRNSVHEVLGGTGAFVADAADPRGRPISTTAARYPVITGDYAARPELGVACRSSPGRRSAKPTPVFTKLDESVVDEELARWTRATSASAAEMPRSGRAPSAPSVTPRGARRRRRTRCPSPVVDNHTHLDIPSRAATSRLGRRPTPARAAAAVGVDRGSSRSAATSPASRCHVEARRAPRRELLGAVALHPNEAPRLAGAGRPGRGVRARSSRWRATRGSASSARPASTTSAPAPEGGPRSRTSFRWHIDLAKRPGMALQIHDRDAHADVLRDPGGGGRARAHGPALLLRRRRDGARVRRAAATYLSFAGTVTFNNARAPARGAARCPARPAAGRDRRAVPHAGPAPGCAERLVLVPLTVRAMAAVLNVDVPTLCRAVSENSERVYGPWGAERIGQTA